MLCFGRRLSTAVGFQWAVIKKSKRFEDHCVEVLPTENPVKAKNENTSTITANESPSLLTLR